MLLSLPENQSNNPDYLRSVLSKRIGAKSYEYVKANSKNKSQIKP